MKKYLFNVGLLFGFCLMFFFITRPSLFETKSECVYTSIGVLTRVCVWVGERKRIKEVERKDERGRRGERGFERKL